jgi:hypothetical protein
VNNVLWTMCFSLHFFYYYWIHWIHWIHWRWQQKFTSGPSTSVVTSLHKEWRRLCFFTCLPVGGAPVNVFLGGADKWTDWLIEHGSWHEFLHFYQQFRRHDTLEVYWQPSWVLSVRFEPWLCCMCTDAIIFWLLTFRFPRAVNYPCYVFSVILQVTIVLLTSSTSNSSISVPAVIQFANETYVMNDAVIGSLKTVSRLVTVSRVETLFWCLGLGTWWLGLGLGVGSTDVLVFVKVSWSHY